MSTKFHINDKGEPGVCSAVHQCRFGKDEQHYDTIAEARTAYEKEKVNELFPNGIEKDNLGRRELNKLVKYTDDQEILHKGIETGSPRIRSTILKNRNAGIEVLRELYKTVEEGKGSELERKEIIAHPNYPVEDMSPAEFKKALRTRSLKSIAYREAMLDDNAIGEEHVEVLKESVDNSDLIRVAKNKNNLLTLKTRYELLTSNSATKINALQKGMLAPSEIRKLNEEEFSTLSWYGDRMKSPEHLDEITNVTLSNKFGTDKSQRALSRLVQNDNLSTKAIRAIARNNNGALTADYDENLYKRKNIDDETKRLLIDRTNSVALTARVESIADKVGGMDKLKERVIRDSTDFNAGNAYNKTKVVFDKDELTKLGMGKDEVLTLMNRKAWNADFNYNEDTGVFVGGIDSSG